MSQTTTKQRHGPNDKGMSLIEIIVILVIISSAFVAIVPLFTQGMTAQINYESATTAISIAESKMESLRAVAFDALVSEDAAAVANFPGYTAEVNVSTIDSTLKSITTTVSWASQGGNAKTFQLSTLRTDY